MLFNSPLFLVFFISVFGLYFGISKRFRWLILLIASCFFYMAFIPAYILILVAVIIIDFFAGIEIEKSVGKKKRFFLLLSIFSNIGILFVFKYFNFFHANFDALAQLLHWNYSLPTLSLLLPIGLSFHTFQSLSYIIEVYRGNQKAEKHFGIYALYVMFFPQLVAGPIERPQNLLPQFHNPKEFNASRAVSGLRLMLFGFFKKIVIADNAAILVNFVYARPHESAGWPLLLATFFFAWQIYGDFSGYSDVARGAARIFGFELMKNFDRPYFSKSISEFWRRWHISLSTWFKDYVYIPLGGSRVGKYKQYRNLFLTFLLSGLWHGANWTFVVWGSLNGLYLVFSLITQNIRQRFHDFFHADHFVLFKGIFQTLCTFGLICISWIFFRAASLSESITILTHLGHRFTSIFSLSYVRYELLVEKTLGINKQTFTITLTSIFLLIGIEYLIGQKKLFPWFDRIPRAGKWGLYYVGVFLILWCGYFGNVPFIYFQF